jgi:death-on-curing protein
VSKRRYNPEVVKQIHDDIITRTGGLPGVLNHGLLDAALNKPYQTWGGKDLYPGIIAKAAALAWTLIRNHPFADGNKRTAAVVLITFLRRRRISLAASEVDMETALVSIANGSMTLKQFGAWVESHASRKRPKRPP